MKDLKIVVCKKYIKVIDTSKHIVMLVFTKRNNRLNIFIHRDYNDLFELVSNRKHSAHDDNYSRECIIERTHENIEDDITAYIDSAIESLASA